MNDLEGQVNRRALGGIQVHPLIREFESARSAATPSLPALRELWLEVKRLRIHCLKAGSRDHPVLLLHGGGLECGRPKLSHNYPGFGRTALRIRAGLAWLRPQRSDADVVAS